MDDNFVIQGTPIPKARPRVGKYGVYTPKKTVDFEKKVSRSCAGMHFDGAVKVEIIFQMPIPDSWSRKKKEEMSGRPHTSRPDLDNLVKSVLDGMKDCWEDDKCVTEIRAAKIYADDAMTIVQVTSL